MDICNSSVCLSAFAGFIDFIVAPTMTVLGDVLEAIFRSLEAANAQPGQKPPNSEKKMNRPWVDQLGVNKAKWAAKNEAGQTYDLTVIEIYRYPHLHIQGVVYLVRYNV